MEKGNGRVFYMLGFSLETLKTSFYLRSQPLFQYAKCISERFLFCF